MLVNEAKDARASLLLAHGAGAPMDSGFMNTLAAGLCEQGITVLRFEFPYMDERRRSQKQTPPNRMPVLEASFRAAVAPLVGTPRLFIGGKSMGGRVATMIADSIEPAGLVSGVVALGYPFHPPRRVDKLRVQHLTGLSTPCLIVQGTRDALGSESEVASYALAPSLRVHWLGDGDHSFEPRKASGRTLAQNMAEAVTAIVSFMLPASGAGPDSVRPKQVRARSRKG